MARGKKSEFGNSWWAKKWNGVFNGIGNNERILIGKNYVREERVCDVSIDKGIIKAKVKDIRINPYETTIEVNSLTNEEWDEVIKSMSCRAIFLAKLLSGEMPENIEEVFEDLGFELFPKKVTDMAAACTCQDYIHPCKHVVATYYTVGMEIDNDPFILFKLMGKDKDELLEELKKARAPEDKEVKENIKKGKEKTKKTLKDLEKEIKEFKGLSDKVKDMEFSYEPPQVKYSVLKILGKPSFYDENYEFEKNIGKFYDNAEEKIKQVISEKL